MKFSVQFFIFNGTMNFVISVAIFSSNKLNEYFNERTRDESLTHRISVVCVVYVKRGVGKDA
jgi:hypothetical protein